jgi:hypothetical protein
MLASWDGGAPGVGGLGWDLGDPLWILGMVLQAYFLKLLILLPLPVLSC